MARPGRRVVRDLVWATGLIGLTLVGAATAPPGRIPLDGVGYLLLVIGAGAYAAHRRAPDVVLGVTTACLLVYQLRGYPGFSPAVPVLLALYATARAGHRWVAGTAIGIILAVGFVGEVALSDDTQPPPDVFQRWFLLIGWMVAATVMAEVSRQRRAYLEQVEQRAADAERTREETARRRADEERLRIARELHDSLTHSISIIKVQAGVAIHLARKRDEPVPEALVAIQRASSEAMRELRATLEVLRDDDRGQTGSGLDRLPDLIDGVRTSGLPVTLTIHGRPRTLPVPVDRAAYRIIQEALTNTARHAGLATASVSVTYGEDELIIGVDDDGRGSLSTSVVPGVGLIGMRERVNALNGSLSAGPREGGGFRVRAELPLKPRS